MSSINGINGSGMIPSSSGPSRSSYPGQVSRSRGSDQVELSGISHLVGKLKTNDIRTDKVASIKSQIESGTYDEDDHKLNVAVDRLMNDLDL